MQACSLLDLAGKDLKSCLLHRRALWAKSDEYRRVGLDRAAHSASSDVLSFLEV